MAHINVHQSPARGKETNQKLEIIRTSTNEFKNLYVNNTTKDWKNIPQSIASMDCGGSFKPGELRS